LHAPNNTLHLVPVVLALHGIALHCLHRIGHFTGVQHKKYCIIFASFTWSWSFTGFNLGAYTSLPAAKIPLYFFFGWGEGVSTSTMEWKPSFFWPLIFTLANQSKRQTPVPIRSFSACPVLCSAPAGSSPLTARTCRRSHEVSWAPRRGFRSGAR